MTGRDQQPSTDGTADGSADGSAGDSPQGRLPTPGEPILQVRDAAKAYAGSPVWSGLSLAVWPGEAVALRGPNGAGKTTLLRCILGELPLDSGVVLWDGSPLDDRNPRHRAEIASVLDDMGWFPDVTVAEHLDVLARANGNRHPQQRVAEALAALRIESVADQVPGTLSTGQRRRLALATTLVREFRLLVLDEPEQRLDVEGRRWLAGYLREVVHRAGAVLLASHDDELLGSLPARVLTLDRHD